MSNQSTMSAEEAARIAKTIKLSDRIEWLRRDTEERVIDVYRLIDLTPDNEAVDPKLAEAYQQLTRAALALTDARRQIVIFEDATARRFAEIAASAIDLQRQIYTAGITDDQPSASDQIASRADAIIERGQSARSADAREDDAGYNYTADDLNFDAARERASR